METLLDTELARRFCYWRGLSGRRYIHTIYPAAACPPLSGALYLAVAAEADGGKRVLVAGRFPPFFELMPTFPKACTEVHAHLLAGSDAEARMALEDLTAGLGITENVASVPSSNLTAAAPLLRAPAFA